MGVGAARAWPPQGPRDSMLLLLQELNQRSLELPHLSAAWADLRKPENQGVLGRLAGRAGGGGPGWLESFCLAAGTQ